MTSSTPSTALAKIAPAIGAAARAGVGYLADLIGRIVSKIQMIAPAMLGFGCQAGVVESNSEVPVSTVQAEVVAPADAAVDNDSPRPIGNFHITFYYVVGEDEVAPKPARADRRVAANDNHVVDQLAAVVPPDLVTLYSSKGGTCEPIAEVSQEFAFQLRIQGTGKLRDGRVLNIWGQCPCAQSPCFKVTEKQWGTAGSGRALQPFRTVAVDPRVVKLGSLLYVPLLEGRTMPGRAPWGGFVHDGCVVADDVGGGIKDQQLDLFVGKKAWFLGVSGSAGRHAWARNVQVFDGSKVCQRKGRHVGRKVGAI